MSYKKELLCSFELDSEWKYYPTSQNTCICVNIGSFQLCLLSPFLLLSLQGQNTLIVVSEVSVPISTLWCLDKLLFDQRGSYPAYFQEPLLTMVEHIEMCCWSTFQPVHILLHIFRQYSVPSWADAPIFPEIHHGLNSPEEEFLPILGETELYHDLRLFFRCWQWQPFPIKLDVYLFVPPIKYFTKRFLNLSFTLNEKRFYPLKWCVLLSLLFWVLIICISDMQSHCLSSSCSFCTFSLLIIPFTCHTTECWYSDFFLLWK